ncbi:sensor histidine kinase [Streptomyces sp. NRRL S-340]|uniref:sensor histidine kinase n=1 Tax=Streptomyces sp. NRRL S-340 TaxID=1463901 RepID=UPI001F215869|nr:histidine kinase [Streptomyces sp. NRRL S-340]
MSPPLAVVGGRNDEIPVRRGPWIERGRSALLVLSSFAGGLAMLFLVLEQRPGGGWRVLDISVGAVASLVLLVRYRAPVVVGLVLAVAGAFCATAGVANYVALFAVARSRGIEQAFVVALADIAGALVFWLLYPANSALSLTVVVNTAIALAVVAWGALQQKQQDLVAVYRDRAARIEREREQRAEQIQMAERARIARDMHDSVAHYISLIALYAGGLAVAGDNAKNVGTTAATIRTTAISALDELRTVIGMLRDGTVVTPQTAEHEHTVAGLIDEARQAGQLIVAHLDPPDNSDSTGSTATRRELPSAEHVYRVVQEGLTNARKHAPGALVTVNVRREGSDALVTITNPIEETESALPGTGAGLSGLVERIATVGGVVDHEVVDRGENTHEFRLTARVPLR